MCVCSNFRDIFSCHFNFIIIWNVATFMASLERHNDDQNERRKSGRAKEDEKFNLIDCETDESSLNFDMENVLSSRERQVG